MHLQAQPHGAEPFDLFCNSIVDNFTTLLQERIITNLNLKSLSGELESYCLMWSLRPYINDEIVHQAWRLIP